MGTHRHLFRRALFVFGLLLFTGFAGFVSSTVTAQNVTQGYQSDEILQKGMIVRLKPDDGSKIQALKQSEDADMLGVVVSSADAPVSLSNLGAGQEVFVATFGRYDVLLSTQNGPVKSGDLISISSLAGVGMKAGSSQELVIGKALQDFDGTSTSEGQTVLDTSDGKRNVSLGRVQVEIAVTRNPLYQKDNQPGVPHFLSKLAEAVTDRHISPVRIYASVAILILSVVIAGTLLFAGVRSGMISIGRNPLAKRSILKNLIQVTIMSLIVFVIGVIAVYLLLRV